MRSRSQTGMVRRALLAFLATLLLTAPSVAFAAPSDLDCADFGSRELANRELQETNREYGGDIHGLDRDGDGQACETAPSAQIWSVVLSAVGAGLAVTQTPIPAMRRKFIGLVAIGALGGGIVAWLLLLVVPRSTPYWLLGACIGSGAFFSAKRMLHSEEVNQATPRTQPDEPVNFSGLPSLPQALTSKPGQASRSVCSCGAWTFPETRNGVPGIRCSRIPECGRWHATQ